MDRRSKFWVKALGLGLFFLCFGISCERELGDSIEPVPSWRQHFLQNGDQGVDIRSILYVELRDSINPDSANPNTVKLFQASGSPLLAGAIVTGEGAEVPGDISVFNLASGRGAYLAFDPLCDLYPGTDYRLELVGLLLPDGGSLPDLILHFTTGALPPDYPNPFYCDELVLPLVAYDLSDLQGINAGLADDPWNLKLVAAGVTADPPTYQRIADPLYSFGYVLSNLYYWSPNLLAGPPPTPYTLLVYITNRSATDFYLSSTIGWFNLRPYQPATVVDAFDTIDDWTSSDPANTPISLDTADSFEGSSGMQIGVNLPASLNSSVSRPVSAGFPATTTGIMFAFKMSGAGFTRLQLQLHDSAGNVIGSDMEVAGTDSNWNLFTRALPDDFDPLAGPTTFDVTKVDQVSFVFVNSTRGNTLVGDMLVDFLTVGDMPNVAVYYPPEIITPGESLPLYVDVDGSTYWAYDNSGLHILNLLTSGCDTNCPLMDPETALSPSNLAQMAP